MEQQQQRPAFRHINDFKHFVQQTFARMMPWTLVVIMLLQPIKTTDAAKYKGDHCVTKNQPGICKEWGECPVIKTLIESGDYTNREVVSCGFVIREELICCPVIRSESKIDDTTAENQNRSNETKSPPSPNPGTGSNPDTDRPAVRACRRIEKGLNASLSQHILGGTPAELGEFPHMAAIGYNRIGGDDRPPYDIRCGGTLIDKRFVLTAAHCVSDRENYPSIVRLGVVDFSNEEQMSAAVELKIKQTYIHDDYETRLTYNDIAILELERDVEYSEAIYPVCLYTNETDPDTNIKLWVTGWGTVNITTRTFSNILLKAPLHTAPLVHCNKSFTDYGLTRRIPEGVIRSQFCAEDKDQVKDACQGDSGGPLNLIVDQSLKKYRLVGVVSSGFGCASSTPGLYTRVAAFLDFIEKIVWPNGGD